MLENLIIVRKTFTECSRHGPIVGGSLSMAAEMPSINYTCEGFKLVSVFLLQRFSTVFRKVFIRYFLDNNNNKFQSERGLYLFCCNIPVLSSTCKVEADHQADQQTQDVYSETESKINLSVCDKTYRHFRFYFFYCGEKVGYGLGGYDALPLKLWQLRDRSFNVTSTNISLTVELLFAKPGFYVNYERVKV